ncbi:hypothetical protein [Candidatus Poriferisodalis sp.]|uniref:hypothetical protein n=1 Tax=Candidatus Poriferisodalis sp. TaxID=3101277 RepID=UPI003B021F01
MFVLPASDLTALDDWHANGLRATGSSSIVADEVFVLSHRFISGEVLASGRTPGMERNVGWIQRSPLMPTLAYALVPPALGAARASLAAFAVEVDGKVISHVDVLQTD